MLRRLGYWLDDLATDPAFWVGAGLVLVFLILLNLDPGGIVS